VKYGSFGSGRPALLLDTVPLVPGGCYSNEKGRDSTEGRFGEVLDRSDEGRLGHRNEEGVRLGVE